MATDIISALKNAGLTEGETKVYIALLESGPSTSGPIVKRSSVARSIIYEILEKLIQKGLVSYIIKEKTKHYQITDLSKLLEYIDEKERQLTENRKKIEQMLPKLQALKESVKPAEVQVYEGFKGVQTAHEHTYLKLKKGESYSGIGIPAYQPEKYHTYWEKDHMRRARVGINCRLLFNKDTDPKVLKNRNSYRGCDARYMPTPIQTPAWFNVFADTVIIALQSEKGIAIEIVNQEIANSFKAYFEDIWKLTKPFKR